MHQDSPQRSSSRRIALLVFPTNVKWIKNYTPHAGITICVCVCVCFILNTDTILQKSHTAFMSDREIDICQG